MRREELPIFELEAQILDELRQNARLIIQAPTGSGKSTQVPQMLLDRALLGDGEVVILQPRRLAARLLASRVASERAGRLGDEVGYQIRFDKVTSQQTRIRFVTEGILLRQLVHDPELRGVAAILFDEFHERHLYGDITLARALQLQESSRPDLKIIVMSATLEADALQQFLEPCAILTSSGRQHSVTIEYLPKPVRGDAYQIWDLAADELERIARSTDGDVLIFMPGRYEITRTISAIRASQVSHDFVVLPLYGELPPAEQDAALVDYEKRKVIVSTNVAETSLTIGGVRVVIDGGLARIARFDARRGLNTLLVENISRASADQRAGRAGRTAPGHCLRLWTERENLERAPQELPEVKRLDLAEVVLTLKASGVSDVGKFRWLEPPEATALARAEQLLIDLGAVLAGSRVITGIGVRMLAFPVHPRYARMLLAAQERGCVRAIALVAAVTQGRSLLRRAEGKQVREDRADLLGADDESDLFILTRALRFAEKNAFDARRCAQLSINALAAREAAQLADQFLEIARAEGLDTKACEPAPGAIARCVLAGFPDQVAVRLDEGTLRCALVHGRRGLLARESVVHRARLLVASEIREIETPEKERQVLLTLGTRIEEAWLREIFPEAIREGVEVRFDAAARRVTASRQTMFHDLLLGSARANPPLGEAAAILAREVLAGTCPLKNWDNAAEQWMARVSFLATAMPDLALPPMGEEEKLLALEQICAGAMSYKEIKDRAVLPVLKSWLTVPQQQTVEKLAPERTALPNGKKAKIAYRSDAPPTIAARIQDLYGVERNLTIAGGRVPLRLEILAPNHRPIQVTTDLENFWAEQYPRFKKELQRKYPKHEWR